ncbi:YmfQ family protein [Amorphus sp. 3PC139-8]|uniref:YmfQ family protein n=1 Tax=Amorphus sp. 3PC139-8 TaxID=2735676 RepID=UPI00345D90F6
MKRFVRWGEAAFAAALSQLLPRGWAWPLAERSAMADLVAAYAAIWAWVARRDADLLERESYPGTAIELLPEWEATAGLPDPCFPTASLSLRERQQAVEAKFAARGGQSRAYMTALAASLGYAIEITEFSPFECGRSACGDPYWEVGAPLNRYTWTVTVPGPRLTWFEVGLSACGQDPLCRIARAADLECVLQRAKPAHTTLIFSYTGV